MILTFKDGAVVNDKNDLNGIGIYEIEVSDSDAGSLREQLKKEHKWKVGDRVRVEGCRLAGIESVKNMLLTKDENGDLNAMGCYNNEHWILIAENEKLEKFNAGDKVRIHGCETKWAKDNKFAVIKDSKYIGKYACFSKGHNCYNPDHWTPVEDSGVRSPEQNPKEIEKIDKKHGQFGEIFLFDKDIASKIDELVDAVNLLIKKQL